MWFILYATFRIILFIFDVSGYYADPEMGCQAYHVCLLDPSGGSMYPTSFLCPNGTLFQQQIFNCDWWYVLIYLYMSTQFIITAINFVRIFSISYTMVQLKVQCRLCCIRRILWSCWGCFWFFRQWRKRRRWRIRRWKLSSCKSIVRRWVRRSCVQLLVSWSIRYWLS